VHYALVAAMVAGTLVAVQSVILGAFGARLDPFVAATWVHVGGLTFGIAVVLVTRRGFALEAVRAAPWGLLAGVAGILLVTGIAVAVGGIGLASTLAVVTGVQLLVGFGLEAAGVTGRVVAIDPLRIGGALLIVAGVWLVFSRGNVPA
jgi:transporter family-2 protein